jgi:small-conductance mechanosensitive channel
VWQFSLAILTLQTAALGVVDKAKFEAGTGRFVLGAAFFLAACLSAMLIRQGLERGAFARRIQNIEADLPVPSSYVAPVSRRWWHFYWFKSWHLGVLLLVESLGGFFWFAIQPTGRLFASIGVPELFVTVVSAIILQCR